eukprot:scaffold100593_cov17-Tisochrysis_lutea.AAC.1
MQIGLRGPPDRRDASRLASLLEFLSEIQGCTPDLLASPCSPPGHAVFMGFLAVCVCAYAGTCGGYMDGRGRSSEAPNWIRHLLLWCPTARAPWQSRRWWPSFNDVLCALHSRRFNSRVRAAKALGLEPCIKHKRTGACFQRTVCSSRSNPFGHHRPHIQILLFICLCTGSKAVSETTSEEHFGDADETQLTIPEDEKAPLASMEPTGQQQDSSTAGQSRPRRQIRVPDRLLSSELGHKTRTKQAGNG